jgi:hypothetical protein
VKADGTGTLDVGVFNFGFDLFVHDDPIVLLAILCNHSSPEDLPGSIFAAAEALKTITSGWKTILIFAYRFTSPEYLPQNLNSVRTALGDFLGE